MELRIVSGGQTGVDRAALDAALALGVPVGGWCPHGRWAEDGPIPARYPLRETPEADPAQRTRRNVRDSDATLVLSPSPPAGGSLLTIEVARALSRPHLTLDPFVEGPDRAVAWLRRCEVAVLNVAGPRASEVPGVTGHARRWLTAMLAALVSA